MALWSGWNSSLQCRGAISCDIRESLTSLRIICRDASRLRRVYPPEQHVSYFQPTRSIKSWLMERTTSLSKASQCAVDCKTCFLLLITLPVINRELLLPRKIALLFKGSSASSQRVSVAAFTSCSYPCIACFIRSAEVVVPCCWPTSPGSYRRSSI